MNLKKLLFLVIFVIFFIFPFEVKAASNYAVCVYKKDGALSGNIYATVHVVGGSPRADLYGSQTTVNKIWTYVFGGSSDEINKTITKFVEDTRPGMFINEEDASSYFLSSSCPSVSLCEDGSKMWVISTGSNCSGVLAKFSLLKQLSEADVSSLDYATAFGYNGASVNVSYSSILGSCPSDVGVFKLFGIAYSLLRIIAPIGVLLFGSLDIARAVMAADEAKIKKAQALFAKRLVAAIIIFLSFVIVDFIVSITSAGSDAIGCVKSIIS
ncbi:MAG: hypothetical protein PHD02_01610 [Bacilli bacterium]|nr:hypothetical protein [Bacilli bacterium]